MSEQLAEGSEKAFSHVIQHILNSLSVIVTACDPRDITKKGATDGRASSSGFYCHHGKLHLLTGVRRSGDVSVQRFYAKTGGRQFRR